MFKLQSTAKRRKTPPQSADKMQISYLGSKQSKDENEICYTEEEKLKPKQELKT